MEEIGQENEDEVQVQALEAEQEKYWRSYVDDLDNDSEDSETEPMTKNSPKHRTKREDGEKEPDAIKRQPPENALKNSR